MEPKTFHVDAVWDPEAGVWVATSEDVPGLVTEADTLEVLAGKLRVMIPELLEANRALPDRELGPIAFELTGHRSESIRLAS